MESVGLPGYFEDISDVRDMKMRALKARASQIRDIDYARMASVLGAYRGVTSGLGTYVEAFDALRVDRIDSHMEQVCCRVWKLDYRNSTSGHSVADTLGCTAGDRPAH